MPVYHPHLTVSSLKTGTGLHSPLFVYPLYLTQYLVPTNVGGMEMKGRTVMFFGTSTSNTFLIWGGMIIGTDFSSDRIAVSEGESSLLLQSLVL